MTTPSDLPAPFAYERDKLVRGTLMVGAMELRKDKNGNPYYSGEVFDRAKSYKVVLFNKEAIDNEPEPGDVIEGLWKCKEWNDAPQLNLEVMHAFVAARDVNDSRPFVRDSFISRQAWMAYYQEHIEPLIESVSIVVLLRHILTNDDAFWRAPAAKLMHQNWRGGLSEHTHRLLRMFHGLTECGHPSVDDCNRGLVVAGLILHDWLKTKEYEEIAPGKFEIGEWGELIGHLAGGPLQVQRVLIEQQIEMPEKVRLHLFHVLLAHHGQVDWGSPVTPKTAEATLVHFLDNLDGRLSAIEEAGHGVKSRMAGGKVYLFAESEKSDAGA